MHSCSGILPGEQTVNDIGPVEAEGAFWEMYMFMLRTKCRS